MPAFLASLRDLCRFRRGPEDMPYSPRLLVALLVAAAALHVGFDLQNGLGARVGIAEIAGGLAVVGALFALLRGRGKPERFIQTCTALVVVSALFDLLKYPLVTQLPVRQFLEHPGERLALTGGQTLAAFVITLLGIWQLCVWIFTLRRGLDAPLAGAVLAFLALLFANMIATVLVASLAGVA